MKHLGDITKISGYEAPVVDCIIGGSPCQDLSVAGKRAGLGGERSGLYMEQIRIIKEMRCADVLRGRTNVDVRPRYMLWENVPGAFSTNGGKDFAAVIEEAIRVAEPEAPDVRVPEKGWPTSGCFYDVDGRWSVAWRVLDAQFWGTPDKPLPQRRRRIALVADFGGQSAPEILFIRKGVSGDIEPGEQKRKETAGVVGEGSGGAGDQEGEHRCIAFHLLQDPVPNNKVAPCMGQGNSDGGQAVIGVVCPVIAVDQGGGKSGANFHHDLSPTLTCTHGGEPAIAYYEWHSRDVRAKVIKDDTSPTLSAGMGMGGPNMTTPMLIQHVIVNSHILDDQGGSQISTRNDGKCPTLRAEMHGNIPAVMEPVETYYIVRRLTPLECERLQGYPDGWTDIGEWVDSKGKKHKEADSPRYKALGNSIAIPPWKWVLKRLCACYERDATMASLFDGIGGFPYIWEQLNGKGSCLWASEIEEFPIAVTKRRFENE